VLLHTPSVSLNENLNLFVLGIASVRQRLLPQGSHPDSVASAVGAARCEDEKLKTHEEAMPVAMGAVRRDSSRKLRRRKRFRTARSGA
jgi:hypothetical protein